ncbi:hypothetical protein ACWCRC_41360, partial [Streptomyces sp. NPDC001940]
MDIDIDTSIDIDRIAKSPYGQGDLWIGGQWRAASDGRTYPVYDPATGQVVRHSDQRHRNLLRAAPVRDA